MAPNGVRSSPPRNSVTTVGVVGAMARLLPLVLVTIAGPARGDGIATRVVAGPVAHPDLVKSERACNAGKETGSARTRSLALPKVRAEILHDCGSVPAVSRLAIQTDAGWFIEAGFTIEDIGASMSEPRFHFSLVKESLERGSLTDGSPAIVYQSISRHDMVARSGQIVETQLVADVMICDAQDAVRCGRVAYACPVAGCAPVTLTRGLLKTIEQREHAYVP